jgi:YidC/Oxa1 family membrane protein insertase
MCSVSVSFLPLSLRKLEGARIGIPSVLQPGSSAIIGAAGNHCLLRSKKYNGMLLRRVLSHQAVRRSLGFPGAGRALPQSVSVCAIRWNSSGAGADGEGRPETTPDSVIDLTNSADLNSAMDAATTSDAVVQSVKTLGYNPVDLVITTIEAVHNYLDIPYWGAIAVFTIGMRICLLPVALKGAQNANRMAHLKPEMERVQAAMKAAEEGMSDPRIQQRYQMEMKGLFVKHKVNPMRALVMPFLQMPIFISAFMALRQFQDYFPAFATGGTLWFTDLSAADPYMILPVVNALSFLIMIEVGADGMDSSMKSTFKNIMRGLGVVMVPLTMSMPQVHPPHIVELSPTMAIIVSCDCLVQGLFVYWCTNNTLSLAQTMLLKSAAMKNALGLKDPPKPTESESAENPFKKFARVRRDFLSPYIISLSDGSVISTYHNESAYGGAAGASEEGKKR